MLTPAQYESDAPGSLTDTQRAYSSVGLRLFYSANTATYGSNTPGARRAADDRPGRPRRQPAAP